MGGVGDALTRRGGSRGRSTKRARALQSFMAGEWWLDHMYGAGGEEVVAELAGRLPMAVIAALGAP
jgi:hypothetical protein